jgi:hypothetical protein
LGTSEHKAVRLYKSGGSAWTNATPNGTIPSRIEARGGTNRENVYSVSRRLNSIFYLIAVVPGRYRNHGPSRRENIIEHCRPFSYVVIFRRHLRAQANVDELICWIGLKMTFDTP